MNTALRSITTMGALCVFTGFTSLPNVPRDVDRTCFIPKEFFERKEAITTGDCWAQFMESLQTLDALIYFPEDKVTLAQQKGFAFIIGPEANAKNNDVLINFANYAVVAPIDVQPGNKCGIIVQNTFKELGMVVLVQKSRANNLNTPLWKLSNVPHKFQSANDGASKDQLINVRKAGEKPMEFAGEQKGIIAILIGLNKTDGAHKYYKPANAGLQVK